MIDYFREKAPSQIFNWVISMPLKHSDINDPFAITLETQQVYSMWITCGVFVGYNFENPQ